MEQVATVVRPLGPDVTVSYSSKDRPQGRGYDSGVDPHLDGWTNRVLVWDGMNPSSRL
jgi:hypothetical protein